MTFDNADDKTQTKNSKKIIEVYGGSKMRTSF